MTNEAYSVKFRRDKAQSGESDIFLLARNLEKLSCQVKELNQLSKQILQVKNPDVKLELIFKTQTLLFFMSLKEVLNQCDSAASPVLDGRTLTHFQTISEILLTDTPFSEAGHLYFSEAMTSIESRLKQSLLNKLDQITALVQVAEGEDLLAACALLSDLVSSLERTQVNNNQSTTQLKKVYTEFLKRFLDLLALPAFKNQKRDFFQFINLAFTSDPNLYQIDVPFLQEILRKINFVSTDQLVLLLEQSFSKKLFFSPDFEKYTEKLIITFLMRCGFKKDEALNVLAWWKETKDSDTQNSIRFIKNNLKRAINLWKHDAQLLYRLHKTYGIRNFGRYPEQQLIDQGKEKPPSERHILIISPCEDWNGAFSNKKFHKRIKGLPQNVAMTMIEAATLQDVARCLIKIKQKTENYVPFELVIIGGHGDGENIFLSNLQNGKINKADIGRIVQLLQKHAFFVKNLPVITSSCSAGTENGINQTASSEADWIFIGPKNPSYIQSIQLSDHKDQVTVEDIQYRTHNSRSKSLEPVTATFFKNGHLQRTIN